MMKSGLFLILLLVGSSLQLGTIYLDRISSNTDPITGESVLEVEGVDFDDSTLTLDYINGRESPGTGPGYGVNIESSIHNEGNWFIPQDAVVDGDMTVWGLLRPNGGIICDDGNPDDDDTHSFEYSWQLFDDSGDLHILGELTPDGGINMNNLFFVENDTGRTYVSGLTRPDGGIDVNSSEFSVIGDSGEIFGEATMSVEQDLILGTTYEDVRSVTRVATTSATGGDLFIVGQSAMTVPGNLVFAPGYAVGADRSGNNGRVILGALTRAYNLLCDRFPVNDDDGTKDAGQTIYAGQNGGLNGGDIIFQAGSANGPFVGGDLELAVGIPTGGSSPGDIILGGTSYDGAYGNRDNFGYMVTRPKVTEAGHGANTIFRGQSFSSTLTSILGTAGDFFLVSGDSNPGGAANMDYAGDLILSGGVSGTTTGTIYLGRSSNAIAQTGLSAELFVRRWGAASSDASATHIVGQNASDRGGNLWFTAGNASGGSNVGGDIFLSTGTTATGQPGVIILGDQLNNPADLMISRPSRRGAVGAGMTSIFGQQSTSGAGGSLRIESGDGNDWGGDLMLYGGAGDRVRGGNVVITAANGNAAGTVTISAGNADNQAARSGGFVSIWAGSSGMPNDVPGDVVFNAGLVGTGNPSNGRVFVNPNGNASNFNVRATPFIYNQSTTSRTFFIEGQQVGNTVSIGANPGTKFIGSTSNNSNMLNDPNLVRVVYGWPSFPTNFDTYPGDPNSLVYDFSTVVAAVTDTQTFLSALVNALNESTNGHRLINTIACQSGDCWDPQFGLRT